MVVLSIPIQTLYAELIDLLMAIAARRSIGHAPGAFVTNITASRTTSSIFSALRTAWTSVIC